MKDKGLKIVYASIFLVLILFSFASTTINQVSAEINRTYYEATGSTDTDDRNVEQKIKSSVISDALGSFVLSIASLAERLLGFVFKSVTGTTDFPWADRIIFNSVPLLDVNFFSPADGSFFKKSGNDTNIAKIVRNTYFTVLSICIAFLTIIVAIAAIKMSVSALASEKAKYKEAVTKWLFSIVLIFLMHNLMSFIFFVNEAMVEVASNILLKTLDNYDGNAIKKALASQLDTDTLINNFINGNKGDDEVMSYAEIIKNDRYKEMTAALLNDTTYRDNVLKYASDDSAKDRFANFMKKLGAMFASNRFYNSPSAMNPILIVNDTLYCAENEDELNLRKAQWYKYKGKTKEEMEAMYEEDLDFLSKLVFNKDEISEKVNFMVYQTEAAEWLRNSFTFDSSTGKWVKNSNAGDVKVNIIANLAEALKESAFMYRTDKEGKVTGWKPTTVSVSGALLYAIFIAQSLLYFLSYLKRFFYIIVLAIMAPAIVLFDFLGKAIA